MKFKILILAVILLCAGNVFADDDEITVVAKKSVAVASTPTYRDSGSGSFSSTVSPVVTKPASTADGDLIIVWFASDTEHAFSSLIGGWTQIGATVGVGTDSSLTVVYKFASAEGATWTFTDLFAATEGGNYGVLVYDKVNASTPFDVASLQDAETASATPATDAITPTSNNCLIVSVWGFDLVAGVTVAPDDSPACTERVESNTAGFGAVYGEEHLQTTAAAEAHSITISESDTSFWTIMALRPE